MNDEEFVTRLAAAMTPTDPAELRRRYWRWWSVSGWWRPHDRGVKLGPLTVYAYLWDRWECGVSLFGRFGVDSGIIRHGGTWVTR